MTTEQITKDRQGNIYKHCHTCDTPTARWTGYWSDYIPALKLVYYCKTFRCAKCGTVQYESKIMGVQ